MKKRILFAVVAVWMLALLAGPTQVARAATLNVDNTDPACSDSTGAPYCTIQAAIDAASDGDTINVVGGTYNESVVIDKNNLTVLGDSSSQPIITGGLKFDTDLAGLTFQNFYVSGNAVSGLNSVVRMYGAITDLTIDNCVFDGGNVSGRHGFSGGQLEGDVTVTNSEFKDILGWAVFESKSGSGGDGSAMDTVTFAHNNIHHCNGSVVFRGLSTDRTDSVSITQNTWDSIGGNHGEQGQQWAALEVNRAIQVNIADNTVDGVSLGEWGEGQAFQLWDIDALDLHGNQVTNNAQGIYVWGGSGAYAVPGGSIRHNHIAGNVAYGLSVDPTATGGPLDAAGNWWGDASGPAHSTNCGGMGDAVSDNVDYSPWLGSGVDGDPAAPGFQPAVPTEYHVNANSGGYTTGGIQDGIDFSSGGDTIVVHDGIYYENITIDKGLILTADDEAVPIIDGDSDGDTLPDGNVITIAADQVTIDGFEIRNGYNGIAGETSESAIMSNVIHDHLNIPGSAGVGILLWGDNNENAILGNEIYDNDRQGIFVGFADDSRISNDNLISNNTVYQNGLYRYANGPDQSEYGIQLWNADASVIQHNEVYGHDDWTFGHGIYLVQSDGNAIFDNDIHHNNYGVSVYMDSADTYLAGNIIHDQAVNGLTIFDRGSANTLANFNQFCRNAEAGVENLGLSKIDPVDVDATYNWWGSASGPGPVGPGSGDDVSTGVAFGPWDTTPPTDGPCHIDSIHVQKYEDLDGSGDRDDGEPGLNGWLMTLYDDQGQEVMNDATHTVGPEEGWVMFEDLAHGEYTVCETPEKGWINSDPNTTPPCKSITIADSGRGPGPGPLFTWIDHPGDDAYRFTYLGVDIWGLDVVDLNDESLRDRFSEPWYCLLAMLVSLDPGAELDLEALDPRPFLEWDISEGFEDGLFYLTIESEYLQGPVVLGVKTWRGGGGYSTATAFVECGGPPTALFGNYRPGSITILKETTGDGSKIEFSFTGDLGDFCLGSGGSQAFTDLAPGVYTVAEELPPDDWALLSIVCQEDKIPLPEEVAQVNIEERRVEIALQSGQDVTCTFLNERADLEDMHPYQIFLPVILR